MQLAVVAAGFTPGESDQLRRSMAAWKRKGGLRALRAASASTACAKTATTTNSRSRSTSRSSASANTAFPNRTRRASRCWSTSRRGSSTTSRRRSPARCSTRSRWAFIRRRSLRRMLRRHGVVIRARRCHAQRLRVHAGKPGRRRFFHRCPRSPHSRGEGRGNPVSLDRSATRAASRIVPGQGPVAGRPPNVWSLRACTGRFRQRRRSCAPCQPQRARHACAGRRRRAGGLERSSAACAVGRQRHRTSRASYSRTRASSKSSRASPRPPRVKISSPITRAWA